MTDNDQGVRLWFAVCPKQLCSKNICGAELRYGAGGGGVALALVGVCPRKKYQLPTRLASAGFDLCDVIQSVVKHCEQFR